MADQKFHEVPKASKSRVKTLEFDEYGVCEHTAKTCYFDCSLFHLLIQVWEIKHRGRQTNFMPLFVNANIVLWTYSNYMYL